MGRDCKICGSTKNLQAHHIAPARRFKTRYNPSNGVTLCKGCHCWEKWDYEVFKSMLVPKISQEVYDYWQTVSQGHRSYSVDELEAIKKKLQHVYEYLQENQR